MRANPVERASAGAGAARAIATETELSVSFSTVQLPLSHHMRQSIWPRSMRKLVSLYLYGFSTAQELRMKWLKVDTLEEWRSVADEGEILPLCVIFTN